MISVKNLIFSFQRLQGAAVNPSGFMHDPKLPFEYLRKCGVGEAKHNLTPNFCKYFLNF